MSADSLVAIKRYSLQVELSSFLRIQNNNITNFIDILESKDSLKRVSSGTTSIIYLFFIYKYVDVILDDLLTSLTIDFKEIYIAIIYKAVFALDSI